MKPVIGLLIALAAGVCAAADTYKWVDEKGVTNYGEKPPVDRPARQVDTHPGGIVESGSVLNKQLEAEKRRRAEERRIEFVPVPVPPPAAVAAPVRGMDFDTFIRLQRGMTEGELLIRAGKPDHESVENFRHDIVKTYYYFPTVADPYTTAVTLRGGRIADVDRVRKF